MNERVHEKAGGGQQPRERLGRELSVTDDTLGDTDDFLQVESGCGTQCSLLHLSLSSVHFYLATSSLTGIKYAFAIFFYNYR